MTAKVLNSATKHPKDRHHPPLHPNWVAAFELGPGSIILHPCFRAGGGYRSPRRRRFLKEYALCDSVTCLHD